MYSLKEQLTKKADYPVYTSDLKKRLEEIKEQEDPVPWYRSILGTTKEDLISDIQKQIEERESQYGNISLDEAKKRIYDDKPYPYLGPAGLGTTMGALGAGIPYLAGASGTTSLASGLALGGLGTYLGERFDRMSN